MAQQLDELSKGSIAYDFDGLQRLCVGAPQAQLSVEMLFLPVSDLTMLSPQKLTALIQVRSM